jgi:hypothetical protein
MREAGREHPQVTFFHIPAKHGPVGIHHRNAGAPIEHIRSLIRGMPVHFTIAAGGQAHVDASDVSGRRRFPFRYLVGPSTFFDALLGEVEGIPQRHNITVAGRRWGVGVGIQAEECLVFLTGVARRMIVLRLLCAYALLGVDSQP